MNRTQILLLDDHALFREGLTRLLEGQPDLQISAVTGTVSDALQVLRQQEINLVLLDYDLGPEHGIDFIRQARDAGFQGKFLVVTAGISDLELVRALDLGVSGVFPKHSSPALLTQAIQKVMTGETWLDQGSVQALVDVAKRREMINPNRPFTDRENSVLRGVLEGLTNKEIGQRLNSSESAVKAVLQQLFQKTGVRTRSQLVRIALEEHQFRPKA